MRYLLEGTSRLLKENCYVMILHFNFHFCRKTFFSFAKSILLLVLDSQYNISLNLNELEYRLQSFTLN